MSKTVGIEGVRYMAGDLIGFYAPNADGEPENRFAKPCLLLEKPCFKGKAMKGAMP